VVVGTRQPHISPTPASLSARGVRRRCGLRHRHRRGRPAQLRQQGDQRRTDRGPSDLEGLCAWLPIGAGDWSRSAPVWWRAMSGTTGGRSDEVRPRRKWPSPCPVTMSWTGRGGQQLGPSPSTPHRGRCGRGWSRWAGTPARAGTAMTDRQRQAAQRGQDRARTAGPGRCGHPAHVAGRLGVHVRTDPRGLPTASGRPCDPEAPSPCSPDPSTPHSAHACSAGSPTSGTSSRPRSAANSPDQPTLGSRALSNRRIRSRRRAR
jgi:hypothetical protein